MTKQSSAAAVGQRDATEVGAVHTRNAVVPGQPFVHERVVRRQNIARPTSEREVNGERRISAAGGVSAARLTATPVPSDSPR